jgi:2-polyprenyl-6-methoxyphenol hydroxylase-like FAD-dependent oxidoreductase
MKIMVLGAGVQGTLYGVRLAREGHDVTLVAHAARAAELRQRGAIIEDALSGRTETACLAIEERLVPSAEAAVCLVAVRRQCSPPLARCPRVPRSRGQYRQRSGSLRRDQATADGGRIQRSRRCLAL